MGVVSWATLWPQMGEFYECGVCCGLFGGLWFNLVSVRCTKFSMEMSICLPSLVIPIQVQFALYFSNSINGYFVMVFYFIDDVEGVIFGKIMDIKVVNADRKYGLALCQFPDSGGVIHGI